MLSGILKDLLHTQMYRLGSCGLCVLDRIGFRAESPFGEPGYGFHASDRKTRHDRTESVTGQWRPAVGHGRESSTRPNSARRVSNRIRIPIHTRTKLSTRLDLCSSPLRRGRLPVHLLGHDFTKLPSRPGCSDIPADQVQNTLNAPLPLACLHMIDPLFPPP